jgi:hypothetical protein
MTVAFADLVRQTVASAPGTGSTIALSAAQTGWLTFALAGVTNGATVRYAINDPGTNNTEVGTATYNSSGPSLTSRTPTKSSNSNAAINASASSIIISCAASEDLAVGGTNYGTMAGQNASSVAITGGTIAGISSLGISVPSGLGAGLSINQAATGSSGFPTGNALNLINVTSDNAALGGAAFLSALDVSHVIGGSAMTGGRQTISAYMQLTAASSGSNPNRNYSAIFGSGSASSSDGGTNTGAGALGAIFSLSTFANLQSGATNFLNLGVELDFAVSTGASVKYNTGLGLVAHALHQVAGASQDSLLSFTGQSGTAGFTDAIVIGDYGTAQPLNSSGSILTILNPNSTATSIAYGIDLLNGTFSGASFRAPGFIMSGSGSMGVGTQTPDSKFTLSANTGNTKTPPSGTIFHMIGLSSSKYLFDGFGGQPLIVGRRADGTLGSESAVQSGETLFALSGQGYGATGYGAGGRAFFGMVAAQNWTDTAQGAEMILQTTPLNSTTLTSAMQIWPSGGVSIGQFITDPGTGNLIVSGSTSTQNLGITGVITVASLPSASSAAGFIARVSDGTPGLVPGAPVTGGFSTPYLVWSNGTSWTVIGK